MALFSELRRRHVVQVGVAYLVIAWGAAQVCQLVLDAFDIPGWIMQLVLLVLAMGLPVALVLAWAYRWRTGSIQREDEAEPANTVPAPDSTIAIDPVVEHESIAVLPFVNMSSDAEQEYFSDGIAEELLNLLARIPELRVAARTSAFAFKGKDLDIPEMARRLQVAHVLEGSVRKAGNRIRITAQLIEAESGYHLWSESWDRTLEDIFAVQDEIAAEVVGRLKLTLLKPLPVARKVDPEAYTLYLQARHFSRIRSARSSEQALDLYDQVLAIAPDFAPALAGKADIYTMQADYGLIANETGHARAREAVSRALTIDPDCAQAHAEQGWIALQYDLDFAAAARHYEKALSIAPTDLAILGKAANLALMLGRFDRAQALFDYLVSRDPVNPVLQCDLGRFHYCAGGLDAGIACCRTALKLEPGMIATHSAIARALLKKGDGAMALEESMAEPHEGFQAEAQALIYAAMGRQAEADAALARMIEWGDDAAMNIAFVLADRGEADLAFQWLEKARVLHDTGLKFLYVPRFSHALHSDPRWEPFLASLGMAPEQMNAIEFDVRPPRSANRRTTSELSDLFPVLTARQ